jgi:spore germination cell wall hydrolase CwlJ-like protein
MSDKEALWILAQTIFGEARGEPLLGQYAVGHVVLNRASDPRWGRSIAAVCLQRYQFSCWLAEDPNRARLDHVSLQDPAFVQCLQVALAILSGAHADQTQGATHYHTTAVRPAWAREHTPCYTIGHHVFYNDVP